MRVSPRSPASRWVWPESLETLSLTDVGDRGVDVREVRPSTGGHVTEPPVVSGPTFEHREDERGVAIAGGLVDS